MSDYFITLGKKAVSRRIGKSLGITFPQELQRAEEPWNESELAGKNILFGSTDIHQYKDSLSENIAAAGATISDPSSASALNGIIFEADVSTVSDLASLYEYVHAHLGKLSRCGRVIILAEAPSSLHNEMFVASATSLQGFVRSLAKELGRYGSTANLIYVSGELKKKNEQRRLAAPLIFLLSSRSAYISGQVFYINEKAAFPSQAPHAASLKNKTALVTGAARGIGAETARHLAAEGAQVIIIDRPQEEHAAMQIAHEINGSFFPLDISSENAGVVLEKFLLEKAGGVDVVVHNAGITRDRTIRYMSRQQWDSVLQVNLASILSMTEVLLKKTIRNEGRIVCLSSIGGIAGNPGQTNYASSKAGLIGYVSALAPALAPRGITINAVAPGVIETKMYQAMPFMKREIGRRLNNLNQGGLPADVAETITFLSLPAACGITGRTIRVCGGSLLGA